VQGDTSRADAKEYPKNDSTRRLIRNAIEDCMLFEALDEEVIQVLISSMHPQTAQVRFTCAHTSPLVSAGVGRKVMVRSSLYESQISGI
jgi:hypothetical protein